MPYLYMRVVLIITLLSQSVSYACTDFKLVAKDNTILISRSLEFGMDLNSHLRNSNRGREFSSTTPNQKTGLSWKAIYGYLYVDALDQPYAIDGMNEKGLSFEYLYLPGETQYQNVPNGKDSQAIPYLRLGDWILSLFQNVDEVKQALQSKFIYSETIPALGSMVFPLHAAVFDATGKGIVIEFIKGEMHIYEHIGIMTNSPSYDWQVNNLRNYLNLTPYNPSPVSVNGMTFSATGQGAGMVGLPGDVSPPSRFVKIAFMLKNAYPTNDASGALTLAQHIMNNVDIPTGLARTIDDGKESTDMTEWVVFKDLSHLIFYFRSYEDMTLKSVAMKNIDFSEKAPSFKVPLATKPYVVDVTSKLLGSAISKMTPSAE